MDIIENEVLICENCGTVCNGNENYCHDCGCVLNRRWQQPQMMIGDYSVEIVGNFIEKNKIRYIKVFKRFEDKKNFCHLNWAALFLSAFWFFYRKMYKQGIILLSIAMIVMCGIDVTLYSINREKIVEDNNIIKTYEQQQNLSSSEYTYDDYSFALNDLKEIDKQANHLIYSFSSSYWIGIALSADSIYYKHIMKKINSSDGGVSVGMAFLCVPIVLLMEYLECIFENFLCLIIK